MKSANINSASDCRRLLKPLAAGCDDGGMKFHLLHFKPKSLPPLNKQALAALLLTATFSSATLAQAGAECVAGGTVQQSNACAIKDFQQTDTDNQILYGDVMRILSAHERPALRKEQNEWSRQRVTQCKQSTKAFEAQADWPSRYHGCLVQQIKARDAVLKRWLHLGPPD